MNDEREVYNFMIITIWLLLSSS